MRLEREPRRQPPAPGRRAGEAERRTSYVLQWQYGSHDSSSQRPQTKSSRPGGGGTARITYEYVAPAVCGARGARGTPGRPSDERWK